jgi:hypothetical protein
MASHGSGVVLQSVPEELTVVFSVDKQRAERSFARSSVRSRICR